MCRDLLDSWLKGKPEEISKKTNTDVFCRYNFPNYWRLVTNQTALSTTIIKISNEEKSFWKTY